MGCIIFGLFFLTLILLTLGGGLLGFIIGIICLVPPIYYVYKRELKYKDADSKTLNRVGWENIFILLGVYLITSLIAIPVIELSSKKDFEEYENSDITYSSWEDSDVPLSKEGISERPDEPYVGMSHELIDRTGWGNYDEKEIIKHLRGDSYRYTWYFCEDDRQYTRTVNVKGEVYYVSSPDMGIPIEDINSEFVKCPK